MRIQLPNGNTIYISDYDWLFRLEEKDVDDFYQSCMADDLGTYIDNPFSGRASIGKLEIDEEEDNID